MLYDWQVRYITFSKKRLYTKYEQMIIVNYKQNKRAFNILYVARYLIHI